MDDKRFARLGAAELAVSQSVARRRALFELYASIGSRSRGFDGWERGRLLRRPLVIYDLSGLPLFYDYPLRVGRKAAGFVRVAATKALGDTVVAVQTTPPGWDLEEVKARLRAHLETNARQATGGRTRLVCYSYPKLALEAEIKTAGEEMPRVLMDVGDFTIVPVEEVESPERSGQVAVSLLGRVTERTAMRRMAAWDRSHEGFEAFVGEHAVLDPERLETVPSRERLAAIDNAMIDLRWIETEKTIDFCCHGGGCRDHVCFCLHPQENNVHCTRASSQMILCYYRYCLSQHDIAQAFGVDDDDLTPWAAVEGGLEDLTHNCFDATLDYSVSFGDYRSEIDARRPCLSDDGGHTRACAGYRQANVWWLGQPRPRSLYIFDPWPANTGAVYWENYNTASYAWVGTLVRRTSTH